MVNRLLVISLCAAVLTSGCFALTEFDDIQTTERETFALPFEMDGNVPQFDILFVVDRPTHYDDNMVEILGGVSGDTDEMQYLGQDLNVTAGPPGNRDVVLHIGVITSDLGAGHGGFPGCDLNGDDGILRTELSAPECGTLEDDYIRVENGVVSNMGEPAPQVGEAVQCLIKAQLMRTTTCPIKQPLQAVKRALEASASSFLQEEGGLAVVFISGEDDCSAEDLSVYDQQLFSPFHCLTQGLDCDQSGDHYRNCVEPPGSALLQTSELAAVLRGAKADQDAVVISVMAGPYNAAVGVEVLEIPDLGMQIRPSCTGELDALPAVRLSMLKDQFADSSVFQEICTPESDVFFESVAHKLAAQAAYRCMPRNPVDTAPDMPGMQADCIIRDVENPDQGDAEIRHAPHPECAVSGYGVTCWEMMFETSCTERYKLVLQRAPGDPMEDRDYEVEANCLVHME